MCIQTVMEPEKGLRCQVFTVLKRGQFDDSVQSVIQRNQNLIHCTTVGQYKQAHMHLHMFPNGNFLGCAETAGSENCHIIGTGDNAALAAFRQQHAWVFRPARV